MDKMEKYYSVRDQIQTGDTILWNGSGVISWAIRRWSDFSHASLVQRLNKYGELKNRIFMVEALNHGLDLTLLSDQIKDYKGEVYWLPMHMTGIQQAYSRSHALIECATTKGYDYGSLFRNILGRVSMDARHYFCSEFVWFNYIEAGIPEAVKLKDKAPRPGDIPEWLNKEPVLIYSSKL